MRKHVPAYQIGLWIVWLTMCLTGMFKPAILCAYNAESERWLQRLDSIVACREQINEAKQQQLQQLLTLKRGMSNVEELYELNSRIYDECFTFDSELAMSLVDANLQIAREQHDQKGVGEWQIKRSFILASTGQLLEATKAVEEIDLRNASRQLRVDYYDQLQYLYSHLSQYSWSSQLKEDYDHRTWIYTDSLYSLALPQDEEYLWWISWQNHHSGNWQAGIETLRPYVDTLSLTNRKHAKLSYVLARLYDDSGDRDLYLQYMARSAIADIQSANQDIASLEELAKVLYDLSEEERGGRTPSLLGRHDKASIDLSRAYTYINVCLETSRIYNNLVRTVSIARVMDDILVSYRERDSRQRQQLMWVTITLAILSLVLLGFAIKVWRQKRHLTESRERLEQMNRDLSSHRSALTQANADLKDAVQKLKDTMEQQAEANRQLEESNYVKEEYVGYVFSLCSAYINKMDEYRKNINRKAKVKLWDEILQMSEKQTLVQDELKEFYQNFDAIFLHIYPDFIQDFNALLQPEERIEPRKGELLNTDLRIYALVRLGISDSVKIAEFLHVSPQTVYNNRLKIRNKAIVPRDEFADHVRRLGRYTPTTAKV